MATTIMTDYLQNQSMGSSEQNFSQHYNMGAGTSIWSLSEMKDRKNDIYI